MKFKPTPGPWYALIDGEWWEVCDQVGGVIVRFRGLEHEGNCRLIAAAPNLLAALSDLVDCHAEGGYVLPDNVVLHFARCAIAEATGRDYI